MEVGDKVPEVLGVDETGKEWRSEELLGAPWVLYFYPKDNTSGCTAEACSFRDTAAVYKQLGVKVIGVSKDSAASHKRFKEQHGLPFPLIVDSDLKLIKEMDVLKPKKMYGREYMGVERTTFVINAEGIISYKTSGRAIKTAHHAEDILEHL